MWIQPIYFESPSQNTTIGLLVVGHEVDERAARDFSNVASSEVTFRFGNIPVAGTLAATQQADLARQLSGSSIHLSGTPREIQLGAERYVVATISLSPDGGPAVSLSVLKSLDKATSFLGGLNHGLIALGLLSVLAGSALVLLISHTFTRPLASLVRKENLEFR